MPADVAAVHSEEARPTLEVVDLDNFAADEFEEGGWLESLGLMPGLAFGSRWKT
jgi:hypothetical protein